MVASLTAAALGCSEPAAPPDGSAAPDAHGDAAVPFAPDSYCPGAAGCESDGDGVLRAGAASQVITARVDGTTDVQTVDVDMDGEFDPGVDEYEDRDGVPGFQGVWMAGFGNARGARGVHDDQYARALALRRGDTTIVLLVIDAIGWFVDEMDLVREMVSDVDVDFVLFAATHGHESRDTVGLWGIEETATGLDPEYMAFVRARAAQAIRDAVAALRPANVQYASFRMRDVTDDVTRWVSDVRDPVVIDDEVRLMRFVEAGTETTIATTVNLAAHPEYLSDENTLLSSDYPHWLREGIEGGAIGPDGELRPGVGGLALFFQGPLGGQIGPGVIHPRAWDGTPIERSDRWATVEAVGTQLAYHCLGALEDGAGSVTDESAAIGFRTRRFPVLVQNRRYHIGLLNRIFDRQGILYDPGRPISADNLPSLETEVSIVDVGRAQIITTPGELDPVLFVGGYDGSYTPTGVPIVAPDNPSPPRLELAPSAPYLRDLARPDAEQVSLFGLANDYLGYFVPSYDFVLDDVSPYIEEAEGDHYEETNSIGVDGWPTIERETRALLAWRPSET